MCAFCYFRGIVDGCELRPLNFKEVEEATKRHAGWAPAIAATSHAPPPPPSPAKPQPLMGDACREHSVAPVRSVCSQLARRARPREMHKCEILAFVPSEQGGEQDVLEKEWCDTICEKNVLSGILVGIP